MVKVADSVIAEINTARVIVCGIGIHHSSVYTGSHSERLNNRTHLIHVLDERIPKLLDSSFFALIKIKPWHYVHGVNSPGLRIHYNPASEGTVVLIVGVLEHGIQETRDSWLKGGNDTTSFFSISIKESITDIAKQLRKEIDRQNFALAVEHFVVRTLKTKLASQFTPIFVSKAHKPH